ncbi:hypothetical protein TPE_0220 [Treponema pedis str. T A4]|uniref:Uncharacterized protein n=1 Tax=Treponema pedis str. T A4 TaxID=1291379 RepID=S6A2J3_9SPIR|nr:hypothetical protein TPE_0220 [Treponema pedis str. T A4]
MRTKPQVRRLFFFWIKVVFKSDFISAGKIRNCIDGSG